jgi:hypothetical protein
VISFSRPYTIAYSNNASQRRLHPAQPNPSSIRLQAQSQETRQTAGEPVPHHHVGNVVYVFHVFLCSMAIRVELTWGKWQLAGHLPVWAPAIAWLPNNRYENAWMDRSVYTTKSYPVLSRRGTVLTYCQSTETSGNEEEHDQLPLGKIIS